MKVPKNQVFSVGDDPKDIIASRESGVKSVAALWGAKSPEKLILENPDFICKSVEELRHLIDLRLINP